MQTCRCGRDRQPLSCWILLLTLVGIRLVYERKVLLAVQLSSLKLCDPDGKNNTKTNQNQNQRKRPRLADTFGLCE